MAPVSVCCQAPSLARHHHHPDHYGIPLQISVVIPVYNRERHISRALDSVVAQSSPADEIIVVDDGSTDNSNNIISNDYPQVNLIQQQNKGVSAARNTAIKAARYDWIAFLDSDDEWLPFKLESIRDAQRQHSQEKLFHSNEIWIRNGVRVNAMKKHAKQGGMIFEQCLPLCAISPSAAVIHRSIFDQIGLFDESLPACEDYDMWLRHCHRFPVFYLEDALIRKYGGHEDQLSRKYWGMDRFRIRTLTKLLELPTLNSRQRELTLAMLHKKLQVLINGAHKHQNFDVLNEFEPLYKKYSSLAC